MRNKKAAMEMSIGTIVTIVLLMTVLILGLILVQKIFFGATDSVDTVNAQVQNEINNLFNTQNEDLVVNLGKTNTAKVKRGGDDFSFIFAYSPDNPDVLRDCEANIRVDESGGDYCDDLSGVSSNDLEGWIKSGTEDFSFDKIIGDVGYGVVTLAIPEDTPTCTQRFHITVECPGETLSKNFFQINVIKGLF